MKSLPNPVLGTDARWRVVKTAVHLIFGVAALLLCWKGVSWAIRPGSSIIADELGNLSRYIGKPWGAGLTILPQWIYNDRPVGYLFERILCARYGFDYAASVVWLLAVHLANAGLAFVLFRRLGVSAALSIAGVAVFGGLSTTAQTATYLGASFDVLCTFFLLASMLSLLLRGWRGTAASALLFFLALRSKEFAIVAPVLFTLFLLCPSERFSWRAVLASLKSKLWPHYLLAAVFAARYASFVPRMQAQTGAANPYSMHVSAATILDSISYYTTLIFGVEGSLSPGLRFLPLLALCALLVYSLIRWRPALLFSVSCYALLLLPVSMLPNIRAPYYVYGPQIFLLAAACLAVEEMAGVIFKRGMPRWIFVSAVALASILSMTLFRQGPYFRNRIAFATTARSVAGRSAHDAAAELSDIGPGAHVYLNHGQETPWLFTAGPCDFLRLLNRGPVTCILQKPESELLALYENDRAEKYFVDYSTDGSLKVRSAAKAPPAQP